MKKINKRRLKYGANNTVLIIGAIVIFVLVNLLAAALSEKFPITRIDLTENGLYEIGNATKNVLAELDEGDNDVTVYYMRGSGEKDSYVNEVVLKYVAASKNLKYEDVFYIKDPGFVNRFTDIENVSEHSLIIENATNGRHRMLNYIDMFEISSDLSTGQRYPSAAILESKLTNALAYCISEEETVVCFTTDHGEPNPAEMSNILAGENITPTQFSLKMADVPPECKMLYIISPVDDFLPEEIDRLDKYLDQGGSVQIAIEPYFELPRLQSYLTEWGVTVEDNVVAEGSPNYSTMDQNTGLDIIFPQVVESGLTKDIVSKNVPVYATLCRSLTFEQDDLGAITDKTVFYTTKQGTAYELIRGENGENSGMSDGVQGVYDLALYLEKTVGEDYDKTARLLVAGSSSFWGVTQYAEVADLTGLLSESSLGNNSFFVDSAYEMIGLNSTKLTIEGKSLSSTRLIMTEAQQKIYRIIFCFALPILIVFAGVIIWLRRRHL